MSGPLDPAGAIALKRDGAELTAGQIRAFVEGISDQSWSDAQVAAMAMAMTLRGLSADETAELTAAMVASGESLRWDSEPPVVDKHATGGVGDTTSLVLAPLLAACGVRVPMISGRGLAHTGGTLDKLESIPGFSVAADGQRLRALVEDHGCAIVAQSDTLAPADRRLYAIRDVTGTVPCEGLITGSILSKKLAAGLHTLLLDIKVGEGSFVADLDGGRALARTMKEVAGRRGLALSVVFSDMSTPLAQHVGHALEVRAALEVLCTEEAQPRLRQLVLALAERCLRDCGHDPSLARQRLASGEAAESFRRMVAAQGGPDRLADIENSLPEAPHRAALIADREATVARWRARDVADVLKSLGGARRQGGDSLDLAVGISDLLCPGDAYRPGDVLAMVHARDRSQLAPALSALQAALVTTRVESPAGLLLD